MLIPGCTFRSIEKHPISIMLLVGLSFFIINQLMPSCADADIYRFITIDGVETFTDSPLQKDAKPVIRESSQQKHKKSARRLSQETHHKPAPSMKEIVEKTVQARINPESTSQQSVEALLPVNGIITSGVGMRIDPIDGKWRHHNGIDIAVPVGTPVHAVADGIAVYSGLRSGYGWTVLIEHDNGMITLYGHNSKNIAGHGQTVKKGDIIALAGSTGRSTGPHVHFEAWQSGANITSVFMPGSSFKIASSQSSYKNAYRFRKEVLADGSVLITNIPSSTP